MANIKIKDKYIPCELEVVEFAVEKGFVCSFENKDKTNTEIANFILLNESRQNSNRNEQYTNAWDALENYDSDIWQ